MFADPIGALPTLYRGNTFRSRTEARYALFLDCVKTPWEHEPEAYASNGIYYLPDFWLPRQNIFLEIKGVDDFDPKKMEMLTHITGYPVVVAVGIPALNPKSYRECASCRAHANKGYYVYRENSHKELVIETGRQFVQCAKCGEIDVDYGIDHKGGLKCKCKAPLLTHSASFHNAYKRSQNERWWNPKNGH